MTCLHVHLLHRLALERLRLDALEQPHLVRARVRVSGQWEGCVAVVLWDDAFPWVRVRARARVRARVRLSWG